MNLATSNAPTCINFIKTNIRASMIKGSKNSAGYDVACLKNIRIAPHHRELIDIGIRLEEPTETNIYFRVSSRISMSIRGLDIGSDVIDNDYTGDIKILICNNSNEGVTINEGEYIAHLIPTMINDSKPISLNERLIFSHKLRDDDRFGSSNSSY